MDTQHLNDIKATNEEEGAAPAPPSAVMQALQSFQAAAEASSKGGTSSCQQSNSTTDAATNSATQQENSDVSAASNATPMSIAAAGPMNAQQQQQQIPNNNGIAAQPIPAPTAQPTQQQQQAIPGNPFILPAANDPASQLWWQQALQTLAAAQNVQQQQPSFAPTPAAPPQQTLQPTVPTANAPVAIDQQQQQQQQVFQLQNLLAFPMLQQQAGGLVQQLQQLQQQQPQQIPEVAAPQSLSPSSVVAPSPAPSATMVMQQSPVTNRPSKRRKGNPAPSLPSLAGGLGSVSGPSVVSMSSSSVHGGSRVSSNNNNDDDDDNKPPQEKSAAELERMTPIERRRYERNLREQQRSYKISQQIKQLRDVLQESNIPFRPNKYSILVSVADYIKQLQGRAIMLDSEHQRLIDTIRQTSDQVNNNNNNNASSASMAGANSLSALSVDGRLNSSVDGNSTTAGDGMEMTPNNDLLFVQGIDYLSVFRHCPYPIGVATLDGRMLDCNRAFEELLQVEAEGSLKDQSFFAFVRNHQDIFQAMAALLKQSSMESETGLDTKPGSQQLFWIGELVSHRNERYPFTITLTNGADDNPLFFSLSASVSFN